MTKPFRVRWSQRARKDLLAIGRYIAQDNPNVARAWVEKLRFCVHEAAAAPKGGRRVPELDRDDVREVFLRAYRIAYRIHASSIEVITVFEGHRLFPADVNVGNEYE